VMSRRGLACLVTLLCLVVRVEAEDVRASVELFVNDTPRGDVIIVLRDATPWVPIEALRAAGLRVDRGTRLQVGATLEKAAVGEAAAKDVAVKDVAVEYVSLDTLRDTLAYRFDDQELQLHVTARPDQFLRQVIPIQTGAPADLIRARNSSAFLNYAATASSADRAATLATDAGISLRGALIRLGASRGATGRYFRSPSHVTLDDTTHLVRWDIGDSIAPGALSAQTRPVLGVSVSRELGIDPYFVRYTPLSLSGEASTPSVAEVYVNGQLVYRERIAPGSFTLSGLPVTIGAGQAEIVLRDTFGREQRLSSTFYEPASLLHPGLQEFHYAAGVQRDESRLFHYRGLTASAAHRVGVTDHLTLGIAANTAPHLLSIEPSLATRVPVGELDLRLSTARQSHESSTAWLGAWSYRTHRLSAAVTLRGSSAASPSSAPTNPQSAIGATAPPTAAGAPTSYAAIPLFAPPRRQVDAQVGWTVGRGVSLSVAGIDGVDWHLERLRRQTVMVSLPAFHRGSLMASWGRATVGGRAGFEASVSWTMQISGRSTVTAGAMRQADGTGLTQLAYQRALPVGSGVGGRLQVSPDGRDIDGMLQVQGERGRIDVRHDSVGSAGSAASSVGATGAIVMAGGHFFATRTIDDAFAVVKVADVPNVRVYASNQLIGRTNRHGEAVVPNLVSYYGNRLAIAPEDVPITYAVGAQEYAIAPALRGGALVRFDASAVRLVIGRFLITGNLLAEPLVPSYGEARIEDVSTHEVSPLGKRGEFFFERLDPGRHRARVLLDGFEYDCALIVPDRSGRSDVAGRPVDLGEILCVGPLSQAARR
jgi:outer membrane usher protein